MHPRSAYLIHLKFIKSKMRNRVIVHTGTLLIQYFFCVKHLSILNSFFSFLLSISTVWPNSKRCVKVFGKFPVSRGEAHFLPVEVFGPVTGNARVDFEVSFAIPENMLVSVFEFRIYLNESS